LGQDGTEDQYDDPEEDDGSDESEEVDPGRELGVYIAEKQWWWYGASP
jgi:hypothetical protein